MHRPYFAPTCIFFRIFPCSPLSSLGPSCCFCIPTLMCSSVVQAKKQQQNTETFFFTRRPDTPCPFFPLRFFLLNLFLGCGYSFKYHPTHGPLFFPYAYLLLPLFLFSIASCVCSFLQPGMIGIFFTSDRTHKGMGGLCSKGSSFTNIISSIQPYYHTSPLGQWMGFGQGCA